jgi:hypothetical protein
MHSGIRPINVIIVEKLLSGSHFSGCM